jgi:hypothetical protein
MQKHFAIVKYMEKSQLVKEFLEKQKISINQKGKIKLAVSPNVYYVDLVSFSSFIGKNKISNLDILGYKTNHSDNIFDSLFILDNKLKFEPFQNKELTKLSTDEKSKAMIFFSKVQDNILGARFIWDRNYERDLLAISCTNPSLEFLFIFDENNEIEQILYEEFWP